MWDVWPAMRFVDEGCLAYYEVIDVGRLAYYEDC